MAEDTARFERVVGTEFSRALTGRIVAAASRVHLRRLPDTPPAHPNNGKKNQKKEAESGLQSLNAGTSSQNAATPGRRYPLIRREIIGHRMGAFCRRFAPGAAVLPARQALALLHQPARHHCIGTFLQVDVQQLTDLLAHIRRITKSRELIRLQRGTRRREKEIPRRIGLVMTIQGALQPTAVRYQYSNRGQWY